MSDRLDVLVDQAHLLLERKMRKMGMYRKKPVVIEAHRWFENGDHPADMVGEPKLDVFALQDQHPELWNADGTVGPVPADAPTYTRLEGAVVRFFRRPEPEYAGDKTHDACGRTWHDHGWIDTLEGGHTVCPGDWIITGVQGEVYPCKPDIFDATYEVEQEG